MLQAIDISTYKNGKRFTRCLAVVMPPWNDSLVVAPKVALDGKDSSLGIPEILHEGLMGSKTSSVDLVLGTHVDHLVLGEGDGEAKVLAGVLPQLGADDVPGADVVPVPEQGVLDVTGDLLAGRQIARGYVDRVNGA